MVLGSNVVDVGFVEFSLRLLVENLVRELISGCCKKINRS